MLAAGCGRWAPFGERPIEERVEHGYVDAKGVRIHYAALGKGPLAILLHGFPDYWYTWRELMPALARDYRVVAIDLRGYNLSDKPEDEQNYSMPHLVSDVAETIRHFEAEKAVIIGHDWGGTIGWNFAMASPEMTERLIVLNAPHPQALLRELANNDEQRRNAQYARNFQQENFHRNLSPEKLVFWIEDEADRKKYLEAFGRSSFAAMMHYFVRNFPAPPYRNESAPSVPVQAPTLMIHGLKDSALLPATLDGTWDLVDHELTIVTLPDAGHFVHHEAPETVERIIVDWLAR